MRLLRILGGKMFRKKTFAICATVAAFSLSACATPNAPVGYQTLSAPTLWSRLNLASDTATILEIEAELASRGLTQSPSGDEYIGRRTSGTVGRSVYARTEPVSGDRDCGDFASPAQAQRFFLQAGGPTRDPHGLDRDGDGNACEWGNTLQSSVRQYRQYAASQAAAARRVQTASRVQSSGRCYTGPRGGTYTMTASGNRNYDGC